MESFFDFKKLVFFFSFPFNDSAASRKKSKDDLDEGKVESFRIADPSDPSSNLALLSTKKSEMKSKGTRLLFFGGSSKDKVESKSLANGRARTLVM